VPRPTTPYWEDADTPEGADGPTLYPGLNTRETAVLDYLDEVKPVTQIETSTELAGNDIYYGTPTDCTGVPRLIVWRARSDVQGTNPTMEVQESSDGMVTWYPIIKPDGYSAIEPTGGGYFTGRVTANSIRIVRLVYYNGATTQGWFEIVRTVA
jgi:hypothetical protein